MRAYGLPKDWDIDYPDQGSQFNFALKSSKGNIKQKCGKYKNFIRNTLNKKATRQIYKGVARAKNRQFIFKQLSEL